MIDGRWCCPALALLALAGCDRAAPPAPRQPATPPMVVPPAAPIPDAWIGKWVGVEGLAVDIQPKGAAGRYRLRIWTMDGTAAYDGMADGAAIRFTRDGKPATLRPAIGAETGLKWLADKKNCLMIQPGEGFCRG